MHTKKTSNTNKLIQISYYFVLTKIQKLQNLKKKKKKTFFLYRPVHPVPVGIDRNWPVWPVRGRYGRYFFRYETGGSSVSDYWLVRYEIDNLVSNLNGFNSSPSPPNQGFARWKGSSKVWKENDSKWFYHCFSLPLLFFVCITCVFCFTLFKTI